MQKIPMQKASNHRNSSPSYETSKKRRYNGPSFDSHGSSQIQDSVIQNDNPILAGEVIGNQEFQCQVYERNMFDLLFLIISEPTPENYRDLDISTRLVANTGVSYAAIKFEASTPIRRISNIAMEEGNITVPPPKPFQRSKSPDTRLFRGI
jgi:hypothetical protein